MKLQNRLISAITIVIVVIFSITTTISYRRFYQISEASVRDYANLLSRNYSSKFDDVISRYRFIAQDLGSATVTGIHIESTLRETLKRYPQFSHIFYAPMNGKVLEMAPYDGDYLDYNLIGYSFWEKAIARGESVVSVPNTAFGKPSLLFFAPAMISYLYGREPSPAGMVVLVLPLEDLFAELEGISLKEDTILYVSDRGGNFLYYQGEGVLPPMNIYGLSTESLGSVVEAQSRGQSGFATFPVQRETGYISFSPISSMGWSLGLIGAYSDITGEILMTLRISGAVLLAGVIIGILLVFLIVRSIIKPIGELTLVARKIAQGDRSIISSVSHDSEVGILSEAMNSMIQEWRDYHLALEKTVAERTGELQSTVEELNASNRSLSDIRSNLEKLVEERSGELRKALSYIDNVVNSMPSALIGIDPEYRVTQWNNEAVRKFSLSRKEAIDRSLFELFPHMKEYRSRLDETVWNRMTSSLSRESKTGGGNVLYEEITLYPLVANGIEGVVIRIDDITERVIMEETLRQSQKMEGIGQLTSGIAHDFNNMLGGIMGSAELLRTSMGQDADAAGYVDMILESVDHAADLTEKLLSFSRKGGRISAPVDIHQILRATITILERTLRKKISIETDFRALASTVTGDRGQLQNCFLNLGINADHAMPEGGTLSFLSDNILLTPGEDYESPSELVPGEYLEILVRDSGMGMDREILSRIFEPFFTTKKRGEGTGLGLSAAYGAIRQHKGRIEVKSEPGVGSEFRILLPLSDEKAPGAVPETEPRRGSGLILIVDDEPILRTSLKKGLEHLGYQVLTAVNGQEGLDVFRERGSIDLVILDMIMPVMDGQECFFKLRELNPELPVLIASGYSREEDIRALYEDGLDAFVRKPYRIVEISRIIGNLLSRKGLEPRDAAE